MKYLKKIISFLLVICMMVGLVIPVSANTGAPTSEDGYVYVSLDINALGDGFIAEPLKVPFSAGECYAQITERFLREMNGIDFNHTGNIQPGGGFYMSAITLPRNININVPDIIWEQIGSVDDGPNTAGDSLGEFDFTWMSGWMYTVNNVMAPMGASDWYPEDGDVCRWQFTVYGYGADLGSDTSWGEEALYAGADRSELVKRVAEINSAANKAEILSDNDILTAYEYAYIVLEDLAVDQGTVDSALDALVTALSATPEPTPEVTPEPTPEVTPEPAGPVDVSVELDATMAMMLSQYPNPKLGNEWSTLSLARNGYEVPDGYYKEYLQQVKKVVVENEGVLPNSSVNKTEYSRVIIGLGSLGVDATDIGGYDLTAWLTSMKKVSQQGINGPIFALLALDTRGYEIPNIVQSAEITGYEPDEEDQVTREELIDYILGREIKKGTADAGGWALSGSSPDPDITAMAIQALAPYRDKRDDVKTAIDRGLDVLSRIQRDSGGYASWGTDNAESVAQVIVALTTLGLDPATDSRFIKSGNNLFDGMLRFYVEGGGFRHILGYGLDRMATLQCGYALEAYTRFLNEENTLYNMTDAVNNITYTVDYDANGGNDAPSAQTKKDGTDLTLSTTEPTKDGYAFKGWADVETATTATYQAGATYKANDDITLYAVWTENVVLEAQWEKDSTGWKYQNADGSYKKNQWAQINGKWYRFDSSEYMQTGWQKISNKWYYFAAGDDGSMQTGWQKISNKWYYFAAGDDGSMQTGWQKISNKWYYFAAGNDGSMQTGWQRINSKWYYFAAGNDGSMQTGWQKISDKWYYFAVGNDGSMQTNKWVGDYYLLGSGVMATNQWIGNYYVGADGR